MRPRQLLWRTRRALPASLLAAGCSRARPARWRPLPAGLSPDPAPQSGPTPPPDRDGVFVAVGHARRFGTARFWEEDGEGLLFCFHLHGFAPLADYVCGERTDAGDEFWRAVIEDWRTRCSRPGGPGWHPYPTSERLIAFSRALGSVETWPLDLREWIAAEIWRQGRYLLRAVEHDIGGNHVLRNAVALCHAGAIYPDSRLSARGLALLERELDRQLLSDGGHEERSTSYHRRLTGELLDVRAILADRDGVPSWLDQAIERARSWQRSLAGPDGRLPLLNDAWEGPPLSLPSAPRPAMQHLSGSGHIVLRHGEDQAVIDVGPIAPPHLPPHAHADALAFTLWIDGEPLLVDRGALTYSGPRRNEFRGTAAHNTVAIDDADQCEFWGDFRAASLPRVGSGGAERIGDAVLVRAWHDGYRRLADPVVHHRVFVWLPGEGLVVVDHLDCERDHLVRSSLHLDPAATKVSADRLGPLRVVKLGDDDPATLQAEEHAPYLGTTRAARRLEDRRRIPPRTPFGWSLLRSATVTALTGEELAIDRPAGELRVPIGTGPDR